MINPRPVRLARSSMRAKLRAFQTAHGQAEAEAIAHDIELLRHADLDLSIKAGALLTFNGLMIGAGINPIVASPGAPLSVDALADPLIALMTAFGVGLMAIAASFSVRAILVGEEFDSQGLEDDPTAILQRLYAAYCAAIDAQARMLATAGAFTLTGGAVSAISFAWAIGDKWFG